MENGISRSSKKLRNYLVLSVAALALTAVGTRASYRSEKSVGGEYVPGELIVKLRDSDNKAAKKMLVASVEKALGAGSVKEVRDFMTDTQLKVVHLNDENKSLRSVIDTLNAEPSVLYAEPNYIVHAFDDGAPNDTDFAKLWGMKNTGQSDSAHQAGKSGADINVMPLWAKGITGSKNIVVAIIDTGIDWTHPDLQANLYTNEKEIAGNGKDDDGNGFVDDVHGYNFSDHTANSNDDHSHGSHCAGTIGGVGNNGKGVAGVNWNVRLLPVKFLSSSGSGSTEGAIEAVNYARIMKVNVMSNSWGGGSFSQALKDAISAANDAGILFVAAAGNDGSNNDSRATYPAGYDLPNVVAVAATDNRDTLASFSNYGTKTVHVAAPGVNIYSSVKGGGYATYSGTSMATPHVAGIAALLMSANPSWTFAEVKDRLIKTSDPVAGLRRKVLAKGRVNAYNAFMGIVPPSQEPDESRWQGKSYSLESAHPYVDNSNVTFTINEPGAKYLRVIFDKVDTEANYDKVSLETSTGDVVDEVTGAVTGYTTDYVKGDTAVIRLRSDSSVSQWGFKISSIQAIYE